MIIEQNNIRFGFRGKVIENSSSHLFEIGEIVDVYLRNETDNVILAANEDEFWYLNNEEVEEVGTEQLFNNVTIEDNQDQIMILKIQNGKLKERIDLLEELLSEASDLLDDIHGYDTETYRKIQRYFNGE